MHLCFIDEAGDLGALSNLPLPDEQPVLVIGGLFVDAANLPALTGHFLDLKHRYFPGLRYPSPRPLDRILPEVKGADIRRNATRGSARQQHHAIGFLDRILGLLRHNDVSHSIFTQKFSPAARNYQRLVELPTFGHSENHAGLQICDIVCSALLFPIACFAYRHQDRD